LRVGVMFVKMQTKGSLLLAGDCYHPLAQGLVLTKNWLDSGSGLRYVVMRCMFNERFAVVAVVTVEAGANVLW